EQWLQTAALHHPDPEFMGKAREALMQAPLDARSGLLGRLLQTGQPILSANLTGEGLLDNAPPEYRALTERFGTRSILFVSIRAQGGAIGTLSLNQNQPEQAYTPEDLTLVQEIADRRGLVVVNARLSRDNLRQSELLRAANADLERRVAARTAEL